jgi:uncharacterized protein HemX
VNRLKNVLTPGTFLLLSSIAIASDIPGVPDAAQVQAASDAGLAPYFAVAFVSLFAALLAGFFMFVKSAQTNQQKMLEQYIENSKQDRESHERALADLASSFQSGLSEISKEVGNVKEGMAHIKGILSNRKDQS